MTAADFSAWVVLMRSRGFAEYQLVKLLGTGNNQITRWRRHGAPVYIGYACAAIVAGLQPFSSDSR